MGTFDYFCNPSIFGKNAGAGQCSKRLASAAGGLPLYLWEKCRGGAVQQKIGERYRWGATPLSLAKMQGQGSKKLASATAGAYPSIFGKMQGQGSAEKKLASAAGGLRLYLAGAGQCSKNLASAAAGGRPLYLWEKHGSPNPYEHPIG